MPEHSSGSDVQATDLAVYADQVRVGSNDRQFLLAFSQRDPDAETSIVVCRVMLAPKTAGELAAVLAGAISNFEKKYAQRIVPADFSIEIVEAKKEAAQG